MSINQSSNLEIAPVKTNLINNRKYRDNRKSANRLNLLVNSMEGKYREALVKGEQPFMWENHNRAHSSFGTT